LANNLPKLILSITKPKKYAKIRKNLILNELIFIFAKRKNSVKAIVKILSSNICLII
jgi:hypothetical protein